MQQTTIQTKPRSFTYSTDVVKIGQRAGILSSVGKEEFRVASPPEFKGEAGVWTPEDLFVAALDSCTMMTFLALAGRNSLTVLEYSSHATGVLESVEGKVSVQQGYSETPHCGGIDSRHGKSKGTSE